VKINVLGGGPAGLYFALLAKRREPSHRVTVIERDGPDDTFGWGIVFSDRTLAFLRERDEPTYTAITAASQTWDNVDVVHRGETVSIHGNGFSGIARLTFLHILHRRCREVGVDLRFRTPVADPAELDDCDLLLAADGANSLVRRVHADFFQPSVDVRQNRYVWLGTSRLFHGLVMIFRRDEHGLFIAHAYKFSPTTSTFIVECPPETWARAGLDGLSDAETCRYLERVFADDLGGQPLLSNDFVRWRNFPLVKNRHWHHGHTVLAGDAAHTAHFSIGSGTKLALEDGGQRPRDAGVSGAGRARRLRGRAQAGAGRLPGGGAPQPRVAGGRRAAPGPRAGAVRLQAHDAQPAHRLRAAQAHGSGVRGPPRCLAGTC
jgi:anthraniloyl-CoA monooxygenase